jgi:hydroxymethylbilane synthase
MKRLGLEEKITEIIPTEISLPAIGQGALGIETRRDDEEVEKRIHFLNDPVSAVAVSGERAFLKRLEGGCQVPIAGFGQTTNLTLRIDGLVGTIDGKKLIRHHVEGPMERPNRWEPSWRDPLEQGQRDPCRSPEIVPIVASK